MRFILLMLLAIVSSGAAGAEWLKVGKSADDGFDYYADPATIHREGDKVNMWIVFDYKTPQVVSDKRFLSSKLQFEYDCKNKRVRNLYATVHAENMGNGNAVASVNLPAAEGEPVSPGNIQEGFWKIACGTAWVQLALASTYIFDIYADAATISRSGDMVKMWGIYDYKIPQVMSDDKRYLSQRTHNEYDCKDERIRTLYVLRHAGNMGKGSPVYSSDGIPGNWTPAASGTVQKGLLKIACGKQ